MASTHSIIVSKTARYEMEGDPQTASEAWLLLHGYGQLARDMLSACEVLANPTRLLVAPEGLSRFYGKGFSETPGASWMTREAREDEIADYIRYLNAVVDTVCPHLPLTVLGFSQGAATASRWAALGSRKPDRLICWAGDVAHDISGDRLEDVELTLVYGTRDRLLNSDRREALLERVRAMGLAFKTESFEGGHRLDRGTLARVSSGSLGPTR